MEHIGGETAAKRGKLSAGVGGGEDRLSALPEDVLIHILLKIRNASVAARTSVLSSRWRRLWALLPSLEFSDAQDSHRIRSALAAHDAPVLRCLHVRSTDASADSVAAWLPIAARRLSGDLTFINTASQRYYVESGIGAFELPCFQNATSIRLDLDLGLALPPSGVFTRLTELYLDCLHLKGTCGLGDVVSSPRCPALHKLILWDVRGMGKLTIRSESLLHLELNTLEDLQQLTIVTPVLEELTVISCFIDFPDPSQLVANISAPQLVSLEWNDAFDPCCVQFDEMAHLQRLCNVAFFAYVTHDLTTNDHSLRLLSHFKVMHSLFLILYYRSDIMSNDLYLMENMTMLPDIAFLSLNVLANGHSFGASSFHILRVCTGVRKLALNFDENPLCPAGCICDQQRSWKTEELVLDRLREVGIIGLTGSGHQLTFMERLFSWARMLKMVTVSFHQSVSENKAKGLCQMLRSFSSPEIYMQFYVYDGLVKKVLYVPKE